MSNNNAIAASDEHAKEINEGHRFEFGKNWQAFLSVVNEDRISLAEASLKESLGTKSLDGLSFLDIGSGSGLFSLAAHRLGAKVHSFDFDPHSVACTKELRRRYGKEGVWVVEQASILDQKYFNQLPKFDVIYSWGVLHHTCAMWEALDNVSQLLTNDGTLLIAIYNDQGNWSKRWRIIKRTYNRLPKILRPLFAGMVLLPRELRFLIKKTISGNAHQYFQYVTHYSEKSWRGMSYWHDLIDWVGGYPFEVAKPEEIVHFFFNKGIIVRRMKTCGGGIGCNEYVLTKVKGLSSK